ncbi:MAG: hypothetical protein ACK52K_09300 [Alphaproteobacteria bacterium]|jgi:hypothetical protein
MAITRAQQQKQLLPGLHKVWGDEYKQYPPQWSEIFQRQTSKRSFEEEQKISMFGLAAVKTEGQGVTYDTAQEAFTARYTHTTYALGFAITEEAIEDNLYIPVAGRYTRALARSMAHTQEIVAASILNNGFTSGLGGDGVVLFSTAHPLVNGGTNSNRPTTGVDLNETALDAARIQIAKWVDERGLLIQAQPTKMIIPVEYAWTAERLLKTVLRPGTSNNDINSIVSTSFLPGGYVVNNRLTDPNAWFLKTDVPDGLKMFERVPVKFSDDGDWETGNMRYKARMRFSVGWSDPLGIWGSPGVN